jgi:hypothetical protein
MITKKRPDLSYLRVFGCDVLYKLTPAARASRPEPAGAAAQVQAFTDVAVRGMMVGYPDDGRDGYYLVYDPVLRRVVTTRDVEFNETSFTVAAGLHKMRRIQSNEWDGIDDDEEEGSIIVAGQGGNEERERDGAGTEIDEKNEVQVQEAPVARPNAEPAVATEPEAPSGAPVALPVQEAIAERAHRRPRAAHGHDTPRWGMVNYEKHGITFNYANDLIEAVEKAMRGTDEKGADESDESDAQAPQTYEEAMTRPDAEQWLKAMAADVEAHEKKRHL